MAERRTTRATALALAALALAAPAATAHGGGTLGTDYRATVASTPPGLEARIVGGDDRIELRRTGDGIYIVLGYDLEPFLRLGPDGVFRNAASLSVPLSEERLPDVQQARRLEAAATAAPRWERVTTGATVVYHDHRAHWMGSTPPAAVREEPGVARVLFDWSIPVETGGARDRIRGNVRYVPPPPTSAWWLATAVAVALGAALGTVAGPRLAARIAWSGALVTVALGLLAAGAAASDEPGGVAGALAVPGLLAAAGLALAGALRRTPALAAPAVASGALVVALLELAPRFAPAFSSGVVPSAMPEPVTRSLLVMGAYATALALVAAGRLLVDAAQAGFDGPQPSPERTIRQIAPEP